MDRLVIKHYLDELPREILESAYSIDIFTVYKRFRAQMDYDQEIYEKYKENIYMPEDGDYCADFIVFKIGAWRIAMEIDREG